MKLKYDKLVFIGRFQPFHDGHKRVIKRALELATYVVVLVGSAGSPRSLRNPWTFEERRDMILGAFPDANGFKDRGPDARRLKIAPLEDFTYDDAGWIESVQQIVGSFCEPRDKIGLIGCQKDHTSYYLKLFPQWGSEGVEFLDPLNATDFREAYFGNGTVEQRWSGLPQNVSDTLWRFHDTPDFLDLHAEHEFISKYKKSWAGSPYPVQFITVDSVVVQSGHVLLIKRKERPGKNLLALPGGFLNHDEKLLDASIRELREETRLKVPEPVLRGSIRGTRYFDDPNRSSRGRTLTHAFYFGLEPKYEEHFQLPKVKGSDDAKAAMWVPLSHLDRGQLYEDHYHIIRAMVKSFQ